MLIRVKKLTKCVNDLISASSCLKHSQTKIWNYVVLIKKLIIIFFYAMNLTNKKNLNVSHTYAHALSATARQTWLPVDFHSFMNDVLNFS
jgi:hypothetical protein